MATHRVLHPLKRFLLRSTGYSYPNMGRLFLRLFIGIMLLTRLRISRYVKIHFLRYSVWVVSAAWWL